VPVQLQVWGEWSPDDRTWTDIEVQHAAMPDSEIEQRARRHSDQEIKREQEAGLLPSDDEIAAMAYPLWNVMDARPRRSPGDLRRAGRAD
jgi:hypothetical protein